MRISVVRAGRRTVRNFPGTLRSITVAGSTLRVLDGKARMSFNSRLSCRCPRWSEGA
jgi:hypothetical protein